jgi:hypothetical protein
LRAVKANDAAHANRILCKQSKLAMADAEGKKSPKRRVDVSSATSVSKAFIMLELFAPVRSVQLSQQGNSDDQGHVLGEVELGASSDVERVRCSFRVIRLVAHVTIKCQGPSTCAAQD